MFFIFHCVLDDQVEISNKTTFITLQSKPGFQGYSQFTEMMYQGKRKNKTKNVELISATAGEGVRQV